MPVIMRCGSWSGEPSRPGEAMARAGAARLQGDKAQAGRQYLSTCPFSTPGVRAAGEMRETANVRNCTVLCYPHAPNAPTHRPPSHLLVFLAGWEETVGRQGWERGVGARQLLPQGWRSLTHMHTCPMPACTIFPSRPLGKGWSPPLSSFLTHQERNPSGSSGGLRLNRTAHSPQPHWAHSPRH